MLKGEGGGCYRICTRLWQYNTQCGYTVYIIHGEKEREEDATEYALGSSDIIHSVGELYIYM